ncbi:MAG: alpha-galactosidase [Planctomycetota bacterium]|jgi:alpha-galactosidase
MKKLKRFAGSGFFWVFAAMMCQGCAVMQAEQGAAAALAHPVKLPFEQVLPGAVSDYEVMQADSGGGKEYILSLSRLSPEGLKMEAKKGRSCAEDKPWLMVRNMKTGRGFAISLAYSGNWRIEVVPQAGNTLLRAVTLPQSLPVFERVKGVFVPGALVAEFNGDWDDGARRITRFIRARLVRDVGEDWPLVQYNTWYDRKHRLDADHLVECARAAAEVGCELFVIDAGWYGQNTDWHKALGDWSVNSERFPKGIEQVADEVRKLGMKFGMWVEIENVNPDSLVGKEHPEWFLRDGEKIATDVRHQDRRCLDFGKPEVLAWAKAEIDRIVSAYKLDYIKMDFNTHLDVDSQKYAGQADPLWRHYRGLAALWKHMRKEYPKLIVENCSSGSLRHDVFTAAHTDTHWLSDAARNNNNLAMNFGATYLFPPETCNHWTCYPHATDYMDLESSFTISMLGHMGLSGKIVSWDEETRRYAADRIALYKEIRPLIRKADVYHLTGQVDQKSPASVQAVQYVDSAADRSVVFAFQGGDASLAANLKLAGLNPDVTYRVSMPPAFRPDRLGKGVELMTEGLRIYFPHEGSSAVIQIAPADDE